MISTIHDYIPGQYVGKETQTTEYISAVDEAAAIELFNSAVRKLLDINNWHSLCGFLSPAFVMTDYAGEPIGGEALVGNFIRINIPGPGTTTGRGYDWVRIEKLKQIDLDARQQLFFMQVRPAPYPLSEVRDIAHFYNDSATSSFMVVREMLQVTAAVYGRNEVPNTNLSNVVDKIRNEVVGNSGAIGLSVMQWKALVAGLLRSPY